MGVGVGGVWGWGSGSVCGGLGLAGWHRQVAGHVCVCTKQATVQVCVCRGPTCVGRGMLCVGKKKCSGACVQCAGSGEATM